MNGLTLDILICDVFDGVMKRFARRLLAEYEDRFRIRITWLHRYTELFINLVDHEFDLYIFHVDNMIPSGLSADSQHDRMHKMSRLFCYIKTFYPKPIIVYSPYLKDPVLKENARESGVDFVLTLPVKSDMLVETVREALDRFTINC